MYLLYCTKLWSKNYLEKWQYTIPTYIYYLKGQCHQMKNLNFLNIEGDWNSCLEVWWNVEVGVHPAVAVQDGQIHATVPLRKKSF